MSAASPTKLVMILSGGYQYAEVDIDQPVQFIAANNVGKTSLIAALQFLFIDSFKHIQCHGGAHIAFFFVFVFMFQQP